MQKRILSIALSLILCLPVLGSPLPASRVSADSSADSFVPGDHLKPISGGYRVISLDGEISAELFSSDNGLYYRVMSDRYSTAVPIISPSRLGVKIDNVTYGEGSELVHAAVSETNRIYSHLGNQSTLTDHGVEAVFTLSQGGYTYYIDLRVYNDGIAFRYRFPLPGGKTEQVVNDELTEFSLPADTTTIWCGRNNQDYEPVIESYDPKTLNTGTGDVSGKLKATDKLNGPITAVLPGDKGYIALLEGGLTGKYAGTNFLADGNCVFRTNITMDSTKDFTISGDVESGWRLINFASDLNGLVNNYNVYHVNSAPDPQLYADTSWIEPGRSSWSWLSDYGTSLDSPDAQYTYTLNAARLGFEYNVIDEGWRRSAWLDASQDYKPALTALGDFGKANHVKQILWTGVTSNAANCYRVNDYATAQGFMDLLNDTGMYGAKIDFWPGEDNPAASLQLQIDVLKLAAQNKKVINFHGTNKPTGLSVTYPNELTREAIRGLENIGAAGNTDYSKQTEWLTRQLFTRYLSGHADWTPACNNAMQIASLVLIDSPLNVIATPPDKILANEAVEMIKSIPTVWDKTVVLSPSKINELSVYAKESHGTWFLGGISNTDTKTLDLQLGDFLGEGSYTMELWVDKADGTKSKTVRTVSRDDVLPVEVVQNRGFVARFDKLTFNRYGGEILIGRKLEITTADPSAVVKYTTDGTDPATSNTALTYTQPVQLKSSCKITAAIVSGDGAGTAIAKQFNLVGDPSIQVNKTFSPGKTHVELTTNFDCTIYYTLDGTEPTTSSYRYIVPFTIDKSADFRAIGVPKSGDTASVAESIPVKNSGDVTPDIDLTAENYISAATGWDNIGINRSCKNTTISLAGKTYEKGVGLNAKGYFLYNVPSGAKQFVGIVGIDDVAKNDPNYPAASGHLVVSFDNQTAFTSSVFYIDETITFAVPVPDGAQQIKIELLDGYDGITCDNISIGNAGWKTTPYVSDWPTPVLDIIAGDLNSDQEINASDVVALRAIIARGNPSDAELAAGDLDQDGSLTKKDVDLLLTLVDILPGDVSGDGAISPLDIMTIRKALLNDTSTENQLAAGDLDGNGKLGATDIMLLRKMMLT